MTCRFIDMHKFVICFAVVTCNLYCTFIHSGFSQAIIMCILASFCSILSPIHEQMIKESSLMFCLLQFNADCVYQQTSCNPCQFQMNHLTDLFFLQNLYHCQHSSRYGGKKNTDCPVEVLLTLKRTAFFRAGQTKKKRPSQ